MTPRDKRSRTQTLDRLEPDADAEEEIQEAFRLATQSHDPTHFAPDDQPVLMVYSTSLVMLRRAQAALAKEGAVTAAGRPSAWLAVSEKLTRQIVALSQRLRLQPLGRFDRAQAARNSRPQLLGPRPWDRDVPHDDPAGQYFSGPPIRR